jgi:hypothetical protein
MKEMYFPKCGRQKNKRPRLYKFLSLESVLEFKERLGSIVLESKAMWSR